MDLSKIIIETDRLRLVPASRKYTKNIFREYREPVIQYMNYGPPESLAILEKRIKKREAEMKKGILFFMVVLLKEGGEFLGCFSLENLEQKNPEMGGWLKESAHGHHYGQEAVAALKQWADKNLTYDHIIWPCAALNIPSRKVAESLGGKIHREYEKTTDSGNLWQFVEYWIPRDEELGGEK